MVWPFIPGKEPPILTIWQFDLDGVEKRKNLWPRRGRKLWK